MKEYKIEGMNFETSKSIAIMAIFSDFRKYCKSKILLTRKHKKRAGRKMKTNKLITLHAESPPQVGNHIFLVTF